MKQIVIELSDELYKEIASEDAIYYPDDGGVVWQAVKKGIVLPEHYGRLIDADALNEAYTYECISECDRCEHCSKDGHGCELLLNAPTILEAKEQDTASGGNYSLQNVPLSDIDEATERFKEKLIEGYFNDKESSDEEIQTMLQALADADKEQSE